MVKTIVRTRSRKRLLVPIIPMRRFSNVKPEHIRNPRNAKSSVPSMVTHEAATYRPRIGLYWVQNVL